MKQLRLNKASPGWRDEDTWEFDNFGLTEDDAARINNVLQAAKAYVAAIKHDEQPENWFVLFDILRDAVEEL